MDIMLVVTSGTYVLAVSRFQPMLRRSLGGHYGSLKTAIIPLLVIKVNNSPTSHRISPIQKKRLSCTKNSNPPILKTGEDHSLSHRPDVEKADKFPYSNKSRKTKVFCLTRDGKLSYLPNCEEVNNKEKWVRLVK